MALFLLLIVLLAIAWGVADFQLQSRIERAPPPLPVPKAAPATSPNVELVPPLETAPVIAQNPAAERAEPAPDSEPAVAVQNTPPAPEVTTEDKGKTGN
ncbi:MAG: hypothetical protein Q7J42_08235 [Sulfuritalea sp.]|nr:hypothetical protein [Sulfuritalea sp.]